VLAHAQGQVRDAQAQLRGDPRVHGGAWGEGGQC
jgi:hypothetical protein